MQPHIITTFLRWYYPDQVLRVLGQCPMSQQIAPLVAFTECLFTISRLADGQQRAISSRIIKHSWYICKMVTSRKGEFVNDSCKRYFGVVWQPNFI